MGRGLFRKVVEEIGKVGEGTPDLRREGYNRGIEINDALLSAYAVFFFQHPSMLQFQRAMKEKRKRDNVETLFGVKNIPCDNEIRKLIDPIEPEKFRAVYDRALRMVEPYGILDEFRVLDGGVLLALDAVVVSVVTGNGLKDIVSAQQAAAQTAGNAGEGGALMSANGSKSNLIRIAPDMALLTEAFAGRGIGG